MIILVNKFFSIISLNVAKKIDDLIVNQASKTLTLSHQKKCKFADQNLLDLQRQLVKNFIRGLKAKLRTIIQDITEEKYAGIGVKKLEVNQDISNSKTNVVSNVETGFFPKTQKAIDEACKEPGCKPEDFQVMENKVPSDNTIKCRINYQDYVSYKAKVKRLDANILANNHDKVNSLKVELKNFDSVVYAEKEIYKKTFGFGRVYINDVQQDEFLKAISNPNARNIPNSFVPAIRSIAKYKRFFDSEDFGLFNKNDTEIVILEYVLNKYVLAEENKNKLIKLDIFTDRITCSSCTNIINNVIHSSKYIAKTKNFNIELLKPDPIFILKESIPLKDNNFLF